MPIATIVILIILTILIFALALFTFSSIYERLADKIDAGKNDEEVKKLFANKKKNKASSIIGNIIELLFVAIIIGLGAISVIYQSNGDQFLINNKSLTVIASNSMDGFYDSEYEDLVLSVKEDAVDQQFAIGDIGIFERIDSDTELIQYDIYGYKTKAGKIIIHRLIDFNGEKLVFRGDNARKADSLVNRDQILFHFTGTKIPYVGNFVLFIKSILGLYTLICIVVIYILTSIYMAKYNKLIEKRYNEIMRQYYTINNPKEVTEPTPTGDDKLLMPKEETPKVEVKEEPKEVEEVKPIADFYRKDGTHVVIYPKGSGKKCVAQKK